MSAPKQHDLTDYRRFRAALGVSTPELQELFAQEVNGLTREELLILKESDFYQPKTWTKAQERIFIKMLARAAVKTKRKRKANHER